MTDTKEQDATARIALSRPGGRLELKKTVDSGVVRQSFSHGRSKAVAVEVKRKRNLMPTGPGGAARPSGGVIAGGRPPEAPTIVRPATEAGRAQARRPVVLKPLTEEEKTARVRALVDSKKVEEEARQRAEDNARRLADDQARRQAEEVAAAKRQAEEEARKKAEEEARRKAEDAAARMLAKEDQERHRRDPGTGISTSTETVADPELEPAPATRPAAEPARPAVKGKPKPTKGEDRTDKGEAKRAAIRREIGARPAGARQRP